MTGDEREQGWDGARREEEDGKCDDETDDVGRELKSCVQTSCRCFEDDIATITVRGQEPRDDDISQSQDGPRQSTYPLPGVFGYVTRRSKDAEHIFAHVLVAARHGYHDGFLSAKYPGAEIHHEHIVAKHSNHEDGYVQEIGQDDMANDEDAERDAEQVLQNPGVIRLAIDEPNGGDDKSQYETRDFVKIDAAIIAPTYSWPKRNQILINNELTGPGREFSRTYVSQVLGSA